jgi:hypothetical protein
VVLSSACCPPSPDQGRPAYTHRSRDGGDGQSFSFQLGSSIEVDIDGWVVATRYMVGLQDRGHLLPVDAEFGGQIAKSGTSFVTPDQVRFICSGEIATHLDGLWTTLLVLANRQVNQPSQTSSLITEV